MNRRRWTILSVIVVAVLAIVLGGLFATPDWAHYRLFHDANSLRAAFNSSIRVGATVGEVQDILGPGRLHSPSATEVARMSKSASRFPESYPDGYQNGDVFLFYAVRPRGSFGLQFRNGTLINFDPAQYSGSQPIGPGM